MLRLHTVTIEYSALKHIFVLFLCLCLPRTKIHPVDAKNRKYKGKNAAFNVELDGLSAF